MAVAAISVGWYVAWCFACCDSAIMARCTVIYDARVIIFGTDKGLGVMALGAILTIGWKMGRCQASCCYTIVARGTIIGNTCMIKNGRYKGAASYVADSAILRCWNVAGMLAGRTTSTAIMTGFTPFTHNFRAAMVDISTEESSRVMAGAAIFISVLMQCCIRRAPGTKCNIIYTSIVA